jgi:hypothetical protein
MQPSSKPGTTYYSVFGLLLSSNLEIPGLAALPVGHRAEDIQITLGAGPDLAAEYPDVYAPAAEEIAYTSAYTDGFGQPILRIFTAANGALLRMVYPDGMQFWLQRTGKRVWCEWPETSSLADAASYLLGPVFGLLMRFRGLTCLHASAVVIGGRAILFPGEEGAGKSTTAAALARRGHSVLSDDIAVLIERDGIFLVQPAYPYLSLWPDSAEMIYGTNNDLPSFSQNFDKRMAAGGSGRVLFESQAKPLGAIFVLGERCEEPDAPRLENIEKREGLLSLVVNSYATNLLSPEMRAREFLLLGRALASVPVRRVRPHKDSRHVERMCELVEQASLG